MDTTIVFVALSIFLFLSLLSSSIGGFAYYTKTPTKAPSPPPKTKIVTSSPPPTTSTETSSPPPTTTVVTSTDTSNSSITATSSATITETSSPSITITSSPTSIKFTKDSNGQNTSDNDNGDLNKVVFLDRHDIDCGSKPINDFKLIYTPSTGKLRYGYYCASGGSLGDSSSKNTTPNDGDGNSGIQFLDRHTVDCGSDSVLTRFKLDRQGGDKILYNYKCIKSNKPLTCRNVSTDANDFGGTHYLDRHDVKCNDDEALNKFKLTRDLTTGQMQYNYKCCKYDDTNTTPQISTSTKFTKDSNGQNTPDNDNGDFNKVVFLDRHDVDCGSNPINDFKLIYTPSTGKLRYGYYCASGGLLGDSSSKNTIPNDGDGNSGIEFLDRHTVDCGSDSVLTRFKLDRQGGDKILYNYKCIKSNKPLTCRNVSTDANDFGGTHYLDRHDVKCNDDEALNKFKLTRDLATGQMQYNYKCCKYDPNSCAGAYDNYTFTTDTWSAGEYSQCNGLKSNNGKFKFVMQSDGNLVLYNENKNAIWASGTYGRGTGPYKFKYQTDGNLVIYDANNTPLWASWTNGKLSTELKMQDDGNVVLYNNSTPVWATNTSPYSCTGGNANYTTTTDTGGVGTFSQCNGFMANNGYFKFVLQSDGNLVLYKGAPGYTYRSVWASGTYGRGTAPYKFSYQPDGNLVIYDANNTAIWSSGTNGKSSTSLKMQNDGNVVLLNNTSPIWATNTANVI